jgi:DNA-binding GntR family transcriptional regulator
MTRPNEIDLEPLDRPEPLGERAYQAIRERIATGSLQPGQRMTERGLALLLGVSPTPVREALRRLEQEGLITRPTVRSLAVVEHSEQTLRELLYAEVLLRAALARFAAAKATDEQIEQLAAIVDRLEEEAECAPADQVLALAAQFDALVVSIADSPPLQNLAAAAGVFGHARRVQAIDAMREQEPETGLRHLRFHRDIVDAFRERDADRAEQLFRDQLLESLTLLLSPLPPATGRADQ